MNQITDSYKTLIDTCRTHDRIGIGIYDLGKQHKFVLRGTHLPVIVVACINSGRLQLSTAQLNHGELHVEVYTHE